MDFCFHGSLSDVISACFCVAKLQLQAARGNTCSYNIRRSKTSTGNAITQESCSPDTRALSDTRESPLKSHGPRGVSLSFMRSCQMWSLERRHDGRVRAGLTATPVVNVPTHVRAAIPLLCTFLKSRLHNEPYIHTCPRRCGKAFTQLNVGKAFTRDCEKGFHTTDRASACSHNSVAVGWRKGFVRACVRLDGF